MNYYYPFAINWPKNNFKMNDIPAVNSEPKNPEGNKMPLKWHSVIEEVAVAFGMSVEEIKLQCRRKKYVDARFMVANLLKEYFSELSQQQIAEQVGYDDHTSVLHAFRQFPSRLAKNSLLKSVFIVVKTAINDKYILPSNSIGESSLPRNASDADDYKGNNKIKEPAFRVGELDDRRLDSFPFAVRFYKALIDAFAMRGMRTIANLRGHFIKEENVLADFHNIWVGTFVGCLSPYRLNNHRITPTYAASRIASLAGMRGKEAFDNVMCYFDEGWGNAPLRDALLEYVEKPVADNTEKKPDHSQSGATHNKPSSPLSGVLGNGNADPEKSIAGAPQSAAKKPELPLIDPDKIPLASLTDSGKYPNAVEGVVDGLIARYGADTTLAGLAKLLAEKPLRLRNAQAIFDVLTGSGKNQFDAAYRAGLAAESGVPFPPTTGQRRLARAANARDISDYAIATAALFRSKVMSDKTPQNN